MNYKKCGKCGSKVFLLELINSCDDCEFNGAWNTEKEDYTYDQETIDNLELVRDHVEEEGECLFGSANGGGCYMVTCELCGHEFNIPLSEG